MESMALKKSAVAEEATTLEITTFVHLGPEAELLILLSIL
jgi:hypothetical protein